MEKQYMNLRFKSNHFEQRYEDFLNLGFFLSKNKPV